MCRVPGPEVTRTRPSWTTSIPRSESGRAGLQRRKRSGFVKRNRGRRQTSGASRLTPDGHVPPGAGVRTVRLGPWPPPTPRSRSCVSLTRASHSRGRHGRLEKRRRLRSGRPVPGRQGRRRTPAKSFRLPHGVFAQATARHPRLRLSPGWLLSTYATGKSPARQARSFPIRAICPSAPSGHKENRLMIFKLANAAK